MRNPIDPPRGGGANSPKPLSQVGKFLGVLWIFLGIGLAFSLYAWPGDDNIFSWSVATPYAPLVAALIGFGGAVLLGFWLLNFWGKLKFRHRGRLLVGISLVWIGFGAGLFGPAALGREGSWETDAWVDPTRDFAVIPVNPLPGEPPDTAYQTGCKVRGVGFEGWRPNPRELTLAITSLGKPDSAWMSSYLFTEGGDLNVVEYSGDIGETYSIKDGLFESGGRGGCNRDFLAFGFVFEYHDDKISACKYDFCQEIVIKQRTGAMTYAAGGGSVLAGTNHGDLLRFDANGWCRMTEVAPKSTYRCLDNFPGPDVGPGMQWYGSVPFGNDSLVGDYPLGAIWLFDGESLSRSEAISPEIIRQPIPELLAPDGTTWVEYYEAQTLAFYCGALWVGNWPHGELLRFDGTNWTKPFTLFSSQTDLPTLYIAADSAGEAPNFLGKRITSLAVHDHVLYVGTGNKWSSRTFNDIEAPDTHLGEYGNIYRVSDAQCGN